MMLPCLRFKMPASTVAGKKIEVIVARTQEADTSTALDAARKLVEQDKVDVQYLVQFSGDETMAVGDYMSKVGELHLIGEPESAVGGSLNAVVHCGWRFGTAVFQCCG